MEGLCFWNFMVVLKFNTKMLIYLIHYLYNLLRDSLINGTSRVSRLS